MSNRTVAEIIGWTGVTTDPLLARQHKPDGYWMPVPTIDAMLAWLRDEGWLASAASSTPWRDDPGGIRLSVWNTKHEVPAITAPTLHAALSAAVLAVAEREEPGDE